MKKGVRGKKVAILVADGFEQSELTGPKEALDKAGAETMIISPSKGQVRGWNHTEWGDSFPVSVALQDASPDMFDAILLPGGVMSPDKLRSNRQAIEFVRHFVNQGKPIAAICHGPWTLIEAGGVRGKRLTSYHSIKSDLVNAGAEWVDAAVVVDHGLVTSRKPDDIPEFNAKMLEEIAEGIHERPEAREGAQPGTEARL